MTNAWMVRGSLQNSSHERSSFIEMRDSRRSSIPLLENLHLSVFLIFSDDIGCFCGIFMKIHPNPPKVSKYEDFLYIVNVHINSTLKIKN